MGMPIITPGKGCREQAITDVIQSIALQEAALAHILNAEGEKMQAIICKEHVTFEQLIEMNKSVEMLLCAVTKLEGVLKGKLAIAQFADIAEDCDD